ncbi:MAG: leucine-rich repeat protein [Clostridiales bacterium]|nr:leucine-rich repeat protein [Clostridiales bacterium]
MNKKVLLTCLSSVCALTCAFRLSACSNTTDGTNEGETYTVSFDAGRGTIFGNRFFEMSVAKNSTVEEPNQEPVCDGYIFIGWNVTGNEDDEMWKFDTDVVAQDTTLRAVWLQSCEVTFEANGGKFEGNTETYKIKVARNSKLTTVPDVTAPDANHALEAWWSIYGEIDLADYTVTRDITLTARWGLSDAVKTALAPYTYSEQYGRITVTGVKDKEAVTSLAVPSVVSYIDDNAFKDCVNLESVVIDDSVSTIGERAFSGCAKLKTVTLPKGLREIEDYTFDGCTALEGIDIPDTLTNLGVGAFRDCSSLTAVELPAGVTKIQGRTFQGCTLLSEVKFGANVTELGSYAFRGCVSLEEFDIPSGVGTLSDGVFYGCSSLKSITVPATCTDIYQSAFCGSGLVTAVIHAKEINSDAFRECKSLANLTIGNEVEELGWEAFRDCVSLTEVVIPDSVTKVAQTFNGCTSLKTVSIGTGLTEIPGGIFSGCYALKEVRFGDNITSIGVSAFKDCISLLSFTVPATVTSVDKKAFSGCSRLVEMYNLTDEPNFLNIAKPMTFTVIHTSASDESIIHSAGDFSFCMFQDSVYPYTEKLCLLDYAGDAEAVTLPADYEGNSYKIFSYALSCKPQLKSVTFPSGVTEIGNEILFGSDNVTTLTVANGNTALTSIGNCIISTADKMFALGCKTSVIPADGSVTAIGSNVFCHNKTIVNDAFKIPESVTVVKSDAFDGMDGIIRTADNGIQYVDKWAVGFDYHSASDIDLEIDAGTVGIADYAFEANTNSWGSWIKSVKTNAELKYIGDNAFYYCENIAEVTLNNGLVSIGNSAFYYCKTLEEIVIPDTVTYMGASVFRYCSALTYVKLSSNLSTIGNFMFTNCKALRSLVIPASVTEIGQYVLGGRDSTDLANSTVYYEGDQAGWNAIRKSNISDDPIHTKSVVCYSETAPSSGRAWHYGADGKPTTKY